MKIAGLGMSPSRCSCVFPCVTTDDREALFLNIMLLKYRGLSWVCVGPDDLV